jgi:hypothetical protein
MSPRRSFAASADCKTDIRGYDARHPGGTPTASVGLLLLLVTTCPMGDARQQTTKHRGNQI